MLTCSCRATRRLLWNSHKLRVLGLSSTGRYLGAALADHVPLATLQQLNLDRAATARESCLNEVLEAVSRASRHAYHGALIVCYN